MPIPGPRNQFGPDPGYSNPWGEEPHRQNLWGRPGPVEDPGRTPGTMEVSTRGSILAPGTVRQMWRQAIGYIAPQAGYSWTQSAPAPGRPIAGPGLYYITRALRYMTRSVYVRGGTDNTRFSELHTQVKQHQAHKTVTVGAGQSRGRPTVRNRLTSFGSRVPALNSKSQASQ